jgi:type II secretory pathway component GspD/PulD (secretin)
VLLDVTLVEVTKNEEFTLDLDLVSKWPRLEAGGTMEGPGLSPLLSPFPEERIIEAVSSAAGGGKAFYADRHIQALLKLMQQKGYGRILAKPKLLVNDNENGEIKSEESTSIVKEETQIIPGTATTAPTATTQVGFESFKAGITLTITPHISKGDQLQLMVKLNRTDFRLQPNYEITSDGEKKTGPTPPDLLTSDVTTKVTVPDSTTIILGGLERLKQSKGGTKVPIIGDIPLIGGLFRSTANTDEQSRLYVFVKAHILRPGEEPSAKSDIEIVSRKNRDRFEAYEEEMQKYEDWPGIKPKPMDPLRALETR